MEQIIEIYENGHINVSGKRTGLAVTQDVRGTIVYTVESKFSGTVYKEHPMPHARYSLEHDKPASGRAGREDFKRDLLALMSADDFSL